MTTDKLNDVKTELTKVQNKIESNEHVKGYNESEFSKTNALRIENVEEGFEQYDYVILEGSEEQYRNFLYKVIELNGSNHSYADFYYSKLTMEQKENFKENLTASDLNYLNSNLFIEDIYFSLTERLMTFLLDITIKEILFSSFYFTKYPCTLWGNYGLKFPIFFKNNTIKKTYQKLADSCGLTFDENNSLKY